MERNRHRRATLAMTRIIAAILVMQGWAAVLSDALTQQHFWNPLHGQFEHLNLDSALDVPDVNDQAACLSNRSERRFEASTCFVPDFVHGSVLASPGGSLPSMSLIPRESGLRACLAVCGHGSCIPFAPKGSPPSPLFQV